MYAFFGQDFFQNMLVNWAANSPDCIKLIQEKAFETSIKNHTVNVGSALPWTCWELVTCVWVATWIKWNQTPHFPFELKELGRSKKNIATLHCFFYVHWAIFFPELKPTTLSDELILSPSKNHSSCLCAFLGNYAKTSCNLVSCNSRLPSAQSLFSLWCF